MTVADSKDIIDQLAATPVSRLMRSPVSTVSPDTPLIDVVDAMHGRSGAAIVAEDGKLVGIFTERDLMLRVDHRDHRWHQLPVSEVMTRKPRTLSPDDNLAHAIGLMSQGLFRHVPIVDGDGRILGIVSIRGILTYAVEHYPKEFINLPPGPNSEASGPWGG